MLIKYFFTDGSKPTFNEINELWKAVQLYTTLNSIKLIIKCPYETIILTDESIIFPKKNISRKKIDFDKIKKIERGGKVLIDVTMKSSEIFFIVFSSRILTSQFLHILTNLKSSVKTTFEIPQNFPFLEITPSELENKQCIICDNLNNAISIEHIVPESFGNQNYVMKKNKICDECNERFSKFEDKALSNSIFLMERARLGITTKKGKAARGKLGELSIKGDSNYRKQYVSIEGLSKENFKNYDSITKRGKLKVKSFDKSEVATSKFLLMIGIESLFTSQKKIYAKYNFKELKIYLNNRSNDDWGFITAKHEYGIFESVPRFSDKLYLKKKNIELRFKEKDETELLFRYRFGGVSMIINLLSRDLEWVKEYKVNEKHTYIYPEHLNAKFDKLNLK